MKYDGKESLETFFCKFDEILRELKAIGGKMDFLMEVNILLLTLPKSFDSLITALDTVEEDKLDLNFVKGKLLDYYLKWKNGENEVVGTTAFSSMKNMSYDSRRKYGNGGKYGNGFYSKNRNNKQFKDKSKFQNNQQYQRSFNFNCFNCGKPGHKKSKCFRNSNFKFNTGANNMISEKNGEEKISFLATSAFSTSMGNEKNYEILEMYIDSGATDHMIDSLEYFSSSQKLKDGIPIAPAKMDKSYWPRISVKLVLIYQMANKEQSKKEN